MITSQIVGDTTNISSSSSKDKYLIGYYLFMLGVLLLLTHPNASYNIVIRFAYLGMLIVPLLFKPRFTPFVIICFYGTCKNACYSLLPESFIFCILIVLILYIIHIRELSFKYSEIKLMLLFFAYSFLISMFNYDMQQNFISVGFVAVLLYPFLKDEDDVRLLALGFCFMSFVLAIMYFQNFDYYSFSVGKDDEFERGTWQNMNVLAGAIGCGLPLSMALLLNVIKGEKPLLLRVFLIINVIFIFFTLVMISSRGALISATSALIILILFSKIKLKYKLLIVISAIIVVLYMFYGGFFNLLMYRMTEESTAETGGGRTVIWESKLIPFFNDDISVQLFGMGKEKCTYYGGFKSTHNDFVTSIVGFGLFGFLLMIFFILAPLFKTSRWNFIQIAAFTLFMLLECMVLEPFYRGYLPYWMFYILVIKLVNIQRQTQIQ